MAKGSSDFLVQFNQSPEFAGYNAFVSDPILAQATATLPDSIKSELDVHGQWAGQGETIRLGHLANNNLPELHTHDSKGKRIDLVEYHPAYHALMRRGFSIGLNSSVWKDGKTESGVRNLARAARLYMTAQVEHGHLCPLVMTNASVAALMSSQKVLKDWLPKILSDKYDSSQKPPGQKDGVTIGMGMTERQGGSDISATMTVAKPKNDGNFEIKGHKWFLSAPMCDAFLVVAQMKKGLGCFLVPRFMPDGTSNGIEFQQLKNKLGNHSNASSEAEFRKSNGVLIGEPGRGIASIMEMVTLTRLDCAVASAGIMRVSLAEAVHHCCHRKAFENFLIDQPLMQRVLADMSLDVAAATALSIRLAASFDRAPANPAEAAYARLMTPVIKYWVCKLAPSLVYEAMECLGGNGYVETGNLARHYREAPLNAIWEGSGNIMCLDVLRVVSKSSEILDSVLTILERDLDSSGAAKVVDVIRTAVKMGDSDPGSARILTEQLALTAAAAELNRLGADVVAAAFTESRLGGLWRSSYGMLDNRHDASSILQTVCPPTKG